MSVAISDVIPAVTRFTLIWISLTLLFGCATAEARREPERKALRTTTAALDTLDDVTTDSNLKDSSSAESDSALRRSYAPADMKFHSCADVQDDGAIVGKACPSALVVFGPYVTVPPQSEVQLRFNIQSKRPLKLMSDVLSEGAKQFHGALETEVTEADGTQAVNYRIHVFDAVRALETRIGIRTEAPADFKITNLSMSIQ